MQHACLDGVKAGTSLAIRLHQETERKAFLRILAEVHFVAVESAKESEAKNEGKGGRSKSRGSSRRKGKTIAMRLAQNEHERALWYRKLNMQVRGTFLENSQFRS